MSPQIQPDLDTTPHSVRRLVVAAALGVLLTLASPPAASGQSCIAPPGNASIEQYCESIPGPGGDRGPSDRHGSGNPVPDGARSQLAGSTDGLGILAFSGAEAERSAFSREQTEARDVAAAREARGSDSEPSSDPFSSVVAALESGETIDTAFIWVLLGAGLVVLGGGWVRYRRRAG